MNRFGIKLTLIFVILLALIFSAGMYWVNQPGTWEEDTVTNQGSTAGFQIEIEEGINKVLENDYLTLYIDSSNMGIIVENKKSLVKWHSNPPGTNPDSVQTQIKLVYFTKKEETRILNSYNDCVIKNQYTAYNIAEGIRIEYRIGTEEKERLIPEAMLRERFEDIVLSKIDDDSLKRRVLRLYKLYSLENLSDREKNDMLARFPVLSEHDIYVLGSLYEHEKNTLEKLYEEIGYTFEDLEFDRNLTGVISESSIKPLFTIPLDYILDGENLVVRLPASQIQYDKNNFSLNSVNILPYFSAGHKDEEGYLLLPDGSGTVVNFAIGENKDEFIRTKRIYGHDNALQRKDYANLTNDIKLPVYGISKSDGAMVTIIETGEALGDIIYEMAGFLHSYTAASSNFYLKTRELYEFVTEYEVWPAYQNRSFDQDITLRYIFLSKDNNEYSDMAKAYRDYLIKNDVLKDRIYDNDISLKLETLGYINKIKNIAGIPINTNIPFTTFEQALDMVQRFKDADIANISLRYHGWSNGGINGTVPGNIKIEKVMGGKKGFKVFQESLNELGVELYLDADFMTVQTNKLFDRFDPRNDASRSLDRKYAGLFQGNLATNLKDFSTFRYLLRPQSTARYIQNYNTWLQKNEIKSLSAGTVGQYLHSDFRISAQTNREEALKMIEEAFSGVKESGSDIVVDGGNAYILPYADYIANIPMWDSGYNIFDFSVPFYQLVIHGYIKYSGKPLNTSQNYVTELLRTIETGAYPSYLIVSDNQHELKDTLYSHYFSIGLETWYDIIISDYNKIKPVIDAVYNKLIIRHSRINENLYKTEYEESFVVMVNYSMDDMIFNNINIPARGYVLYIDNDVDIKVINEYSWR